MVIEKQVPVYIKQEPVSITTTTIVNKPATTATTATTGVTSTSTTTTATTGVTSTSTTTTTKPVVNPYSPKPYCVVNYTNLDEQTWKNVYGTVAGLDDTQTLCEQYGKNYAVNHGWIYVSAKYGY